MKYLGSQALHGFEQLELVQHILLFRHPPGEPLEQDRPGVGQGVNGVTHAVDEAGAVPGLPPEKKPEPASGGSPAYQRLEDVGRRLMEVIAHNKGGTNKDLGRFADQLRALIEKWDR